MTEEENENKEIEFEVGEGVKLLDEECKVCKNADLEHWEWELENAKQELRHAAERCGKAKDKLNEIRSGKYKLIFIEKTGIITCPRCHSSSKR